MYTGMFGYFEGSNLSYGYFSANISFSFGNSSYLDSSTRRHNGIFGLVNVSNISLSSWIINETIVATVNSVGFIGNAVANSSGYVGNAISIYNISLNGSLNQKSQFVGGFIARLTS